MVRIKWLKPLDSIWLFGVMVTLILAHGCITTNLPRVIEHHQNSAFTSSSVITGKIGIGGVVLTSEVIEMEDNMSYSNVLLKTLLKYKGDYTIIPLGQVLQMLDKDSYFSMIKKYRNNELDKDTLSRLGIGNQMRYLAFVKIISNKVTEIERQDYERDKYCEDEKRQARMKLGKIFFLTEEEEREIIRACEHRWDRLITKRTVSVSIEIRDIQGKTVVWSGTISGSKKKSIGFGATEPSNPGTAILGSFVKGFRNALAQPRAPKTEEVLRDIFKSFAMSLP